MADVYFNKPQRLTQLIGAHTTVIVAGRRTGKTDSIASPFVLRNMQRMPGSTGGIVVPTFKHGLTNTIPGLLAAWRRWGLKPGIHYVVGKKPPKSFKPAIIVSQDRPGSANSLTLSWLLIDEARFVDYEKLKNETFPANGGIKSYFGKHSFNHSILILSDMPQTQKGSWFLHYKDEMDPELIEAIKALVLKIFNYKQFLKSQGKPATKDQIYRLHQLDRQLNQLRSVAVYYKEYSSIENLQLLGEAYIRQMKRDLTPATFQTSILCRRLGIAKDGFYSSMRESHKYNASDFAYLDTLGFDPSPDALDSRADADVNPDQPICIGMDYNANINWIVAGQTQGERLNVIKSFYVKFERKLPALIDDFCTYYQHHRNKTVIFYYDTTALGSNYAVNTQDFHWVIVHEFERHGWQINDVYLGNPMRHDEKYLLINQAFQGKQRLTPFFNRQNNDDLILAVQIAGVERGRNGFRKAKGGEKLPESEESPLEIRTDGTDAFDTLYIGCEKFPQLVTSSVSFNGVS